jgi:hypothetical protein
MSLFLNEFIGEGNGPGSSAAIPDFRDKSFVRRKTPGEKTCL